MHATRAKMIPYLRFETLKNHTLYTLLSYVGVPPPAPGHLRELVAVLTVLSESGIAIVYYVQQRV